MKKESDPERDSADIFTEMLRIQGEAAKQVMGTFLPGTENSLPDGMTADSMGATMIEATRRLQEMWMQTAASVAANANLPGGNSGADKTDVPMPVMADPTQWMSMMQGWANQIPAFNSSDGHNVWADGMKLWDSILAQYKPQDDGDTQGDAPQLPRSDKRFADPAWRDQPVFALIHQTYLLLAEQIQQSVDNLDLDDEKEREQLRFATRSVLDAMSPANFPMMNPVVLERTLETKGQNLVKGMERLSGDIERGQLTHTDTSKFKLGENVACTPGKVVHETNLFQLIQYSPTTDEVLEIPLVIFPPWINRFYILDLNPKKSFVKWAVEQGLTVFMVSWKSADESMADVVWDDYIRAQIEAIDVVRARLKVPAVHTIGYCVAGTTLAATLAILARRGEADKVASATFFTAQVDFERAGELKIFIDDNQLEMVRQASKGGYLDGRYMAATFNLLRGSDLIWNYVVNHYLLGEDYPAFDLLYWNGDVTNLPARWHTDYLRDMYRDNKLVVPDAMSADGTAIDLGLIETPAYIQAGREDHIAPAESVFRMTEQLSGEVRFVLAGSGHIAGVVNPPSAEKYQYWTSTKDFDSLDSFVAQAKETKGSWWPDWITWIKGQNNAAVAAKGKRNPGGRGDKVIEDAPGRYVAMR